MAKGRARIELHGLNHVAGGSDPIPGIGEGGGGGGGIQFDTDPQEGEFLEIDTTSDINIDAGVGGSGVGILSLVGADGAGLTGQGDGGVIIAAQGAGDLMIETGGTGGAGIQLKSLAAGTYIILRVASPSSYIQFIGLPTSSPGGSGRVWNNGGVLNIT